MARTTTEHVNAPFGSSGPSTAETLMPFACSGFAACFASCVIHPIDLAKVRLQLFATQNPGVAAPNFVSMIGGMSTYGTARMGLHRTFSDELQRRNGGAALPFAQKAGSSMLGGALAVCVGTPMDVALVRMQADSMKPAAERRNYANVFSALRRIAVEESFGALYKGLAPNILRGMSMNCGMMACSDQAKEAAVALTGDDPADPSIKTRLIAAGAGGFFAAWLSLPFDLLKSRLQDPKAGASLARTAGDVLAKEGPLAFWTGFAAYYSRCAPHAMIILLTIDEVKAKYKAYFQL
ncbi:thiosulfate transmembrane transporter [Aureococcus anophagefferens]|nr:thiosulfate transmembrane transporter [Aureococcus anophagefferens]